MEHCRHYFHKARHHSYRLVDFLVLKRIRRGFTLIELLVVIAILAVLSAIGYATFFGLTRGVNDTKRKNDVNEIAKAYEINYSGGLYHALVGNNFGGGSVPLPPEGGKYNIFPPELETGNMPNFLVCAALENNPSRICSAPATDCFCKYSNEGGLAVVPSSAPTSTPTSSPTPTPLPNNRLGVGYFALNSSYLNTSDAAWTKASQIAHVAFIQRHWKESLNKDGKSFFNSVGDEVSVARSKGLAVYVAFEVLSSDRSVIELPTGLSGNFGSSSVRTAYVDVITQVASTYHPEFFILNVEINRYKQYNFADYEFYKTLYQLAYDAVKVASPNTLVSASLVYEDTPSGGCLDSTDLAAFQGQGFASDFSAKSDILAISVYPTYYLSGIDTSTDPDTLVSEPNLMPETFLNDIASLGTKPLFISETAWPSDSFDFMGYIYGTSQAKQANFVSRLQAAASYANSHGKTISAINYVAIIDIDASLCSQIIAADPNMAWYCSVAPIDKNGVDKSAFSTLTNWKNSL